MATRPPRFPRETYEIASPRLIIRTAIESDAEGLLDFLTTPENFPFFPCSTTLTVEKLRGSIGKWKDMQPKGLNAFLVVILRQTGEVIGQGTYNCFEQVDAPAAAAAAAAAPAADDDADDAVAGDKKLLLTDFGVMLDHKHWRKGLGSEAICSLVEYAVEELDVDLFRTETARDNEPWRALVRNVGLDAFEKFGSQSYDAKVSGWVWNFDADDWRTVKAELQKKGKWPL